jgi:hypothetical protein
MMAGDTRRHLIHIKRRCNFRASPATGVPNARAARCSEAAAPTCNAESGLVVVAGRQAIGDLNPRPEIRPR